MEEVNLVTQNIQLENHYKELVDFFKKTHSKMTRICSKIMKLAKIPQYGKSWAIIIGIDDYQNVNKLTNAVNDAREISELLENIGFDKVIEIYNKDATRDSITGYFLNDDELPSKLDENDRIVIFFADHGHSVINERDNSTSGYLIPYDGHFGKWGSNLSLKKSQLCLEFR